MRPEADRAAKFEANSSESGYVLKRVDRILKVVEVTIRAKVPVREPSEVVEFKL